MRIQAINLFTNFILMLVVIQGIVCDEIRLDQSPAQVKRPGETVKISCKISGFTMTSYWIHWIRQKPGGPLEWIGQRNGGTVYQAESLKSHFTLTEDRSISTQFLEAKSLRAEDTAVYYCARQVRGADYGFDYWGKGTMVTVSSGAPEVPTSIFALSQCGSDSEFVTLGCVMSGFSPADSKKYLWKDASGTDLTDFIQYPDILKDGKYSKISQIRVKAADWEAKKDFTCEVVGTDKKAVIAKPEEILQIPTLYLMKPTSEEINQNNTATFACLATDFSPPVHTFKWMKEVGSEETVITGSYSFTSPANGNNSATSYLQIPGNEWETSGTKITCVFEHKSGNKTRSVEYRFSDDPCDDEKAVEVEIMPPSTEDLLVRKEGWVQCKITKQIQGVNKDYLEWRKDGKAAVLDKKTDLKEDGSSITMKLKVTFEEWENGTKFSCFVPHENIPSGIIKSYKRENGKRHKKPSVFLMPPPEHEHKNMNMTLSMTLTCYAKDFYPKEVFVSWLANDEPLDKSKQTDVINNDGEYSVYSQLTITQLQWQQGVVFSCVVYHESSDATVRMITRSIDITSQKPNVVSLSMNVPQCRSG